MWKYNWSLKKRNNFIKVVMDYITLSLTAYSCKRKYWNRVYWNSRHSGMSQGSSSKSRLSHILWIKNEIQVLKEISRKIYNYNLLSVSYSVSRKAHLNSSLEFCSRLIDWEYWVGIYTYPGNRLDFTEKSQRPGYRLYWNN